MVKKKKRSFFPMFSSGNFIVSEHTLKPLIHYDLIFVHGVT